MITRLIIFVFCFAAGFGILRYSYDITRSLGYVEWAEAKLGGGGTYTFYRIVGIAIMFLSLMYLFGILQKILTALGSLFILG
jgi:hypothetical protein